MAFQPFDLTGKVAVVTGGNGGIGLGMAEGLAASGADVAIWGRNGSKNASALEQLKAHGTRVEALEVDVADEQAVVDAMAESLSRLGRIDTCIANAGVGGGAPLTEQTTEQWRKVTAVNLDAVFWTFREASKHMVERAEKGDKGGSLLVTSSVSAIHGAPQNQAYAATKAGVLAMVRGTAVLPGWIATEMTERLQNWDAFNEKAIGRVPMCRWGEGEDFAGIAVYFASDASKFHTGDSVVIDGGYSIF
jgi:NAD(P)-dependent dehydrogenase (short-subunit alcohol dehydrogenase family)